MSICQVKVSMVSSFEFEFRTSNRSVPNQEVYRACILLDNSASRRRRGLPSGDPTRRVQLEGRAHHLTQSKTLTDVPSPRERGKDMSSGKRPSKATLQRIDQLPEMHGSKRLCCTSGDQRSWLRNGNKPEGAVAQIVEAILPYESSRMKSHPPLCRPAMRDSRRACALCQTILLIHSWEHGSLFSLNSSINLRRYPAPILLAATGMPDPARF